MNPTQITMAVMAALSVLQLGGCLGSGDSAVAETPLTPSGNVTAVEFIGMAAPATDVEFSSVYTKAQVKLTYANGATETKDLAYNRLFYNTDVLSSGVKGTAATYAAAQAFDINGAPLLDEAGKPIIFEAPDANSLIFVPNAPDTAKGGRTAYLVTHYEYDWLDTLGKDQYARMPAAMSLTTLDQSKTDGKLSVVAQKSIDMKGINGLWIPCAGSLSPWNTHLGSEEYEPDARCVVEPAAANCDAAANATNSLGAMVKYGIAKPNPYDYGIATETTVSATGAATIVKHRALGRFSRELPDVMPDQRTVFQGDDGTYNVLTMFVADKAADLSSGTLYAARWNQTGASNGGSATLSWIRLGKGTNAEIAALAQATTFADMFETAPVTKNADGSYVAPPAGFRQIIAGHVSGNVENLKLKPGMEKAAAFLETRRYAAYLGATTEFEKFEGVSHNAKDKKLYVAMTRMDKGMLASKTDPVDHIKLGGKLLAGAVYQLPLAGGQKDSEGNAIDSGYVATDMSVLVAGEDIAKDAVGNTCAVDKICNPDNIKFSEKLRTLFIGEDSSTAHVANFLWAYNVDTRKLSRILSLPAGAESTGLQAINDANGYSYLMSNYQHAGDFSSNIDPALKTRLTPLIDKTKAAVGYISGIPALK